MAQIIANLDLALDSVAEDPHTWPQHASPDYLQDMGAALMGGGRLLFGRATYELMQAAWAGQDNPVGRVMDAAQKVVVSTRLGEATWQNTIILRENPLEQLRALKADGGPDFVLLGSLTLLGSLLDADLVDAMQLNVHPLLRGEGRRLPEAKGLQTFQLREHKAYSGGMTRLRLERTEQ